MLMFGECVVFYLMDKIHTYAGKRNWRGGGGGGGGGGRDGENKRHKDGGDGGNHRKPRDEGWPSMKTIILTACAMNERMRMNEWIPSQAQTTRTSTMPK
jgi:hypothetical protein